MSDLHVHYVFRVDSPHKLALADAVFSHPSGCAEHGVWHKPRHEPHTPFRRQPFRCPAQGEHELAPCAGAAIAKTAKT